MAQRTAKLFSPRLVATRSPAARPAPVTEVAGPGGDVAVLRWLEIDPPAGENEARLLEVLARHREIRGSWRRWSGARGFLRRCPPGCCRAREMRARHPLPRNAASAPEMLGRERPDGVGIKSRSVCPSPLGPLMEVILADERELSQNY